MNTREKIAILKNVKNAILSKLVPITEELLSRLESFGVNLDGYRNHMGTVPIKEENKVIDKPRQYSLTLDDNKKAA